MSRSLVVDASLTIRLILPNPRRASFCSQMERWLQEGYELCAPTLWTYEMTSALSKAAFFGLLTAEEAERSLPLLHDLAIELVPPDAEQIRCAFAWTRRLNRAAAYDSFYLALAESLGCELWTADQRLCNAVDLPWVRSLEESQRLGS
jgi:predicted nucleic acid-binding protein